MLPTLPPPPPPKSDRPCTCLIWAYDDHPDGVHTRIQLIPVCPLHGAFYDTADPMVARRMRVAVGHAWGRAVLQGEPGRWRDHLRKRLDPHPGTGRPITHEEAQERIAAYDKARERDPFCRRCA